MEFPPTQAASEDASTARGPLLHFERGARVVGPDGDLGALHQMVVSRDTGDLRLLVVHTDAGHDIELPADRIVSATEQEIRLSIGPRDLEEHPELARPFSAERYGGGEALLTRTQRSAMRGAGGAADQDAGQLVALAIVGMVVGGAIGGLAYLFTQRRQRAALAGTPPDAAPPAWQAGAQTASARASDALANASAFATALLASARALWPARPVRVSIPTPVVAVVPAATERASTAARAARESIRRQQRSARRGARRFARRVRWMRNGLIVGAILGVLYAPEPGREARQRIARALHNIPWIDALLAPAADNAPSASSHASDLPSSSADLLEEHEPWRPHAEPPYSHLDTPPTIH